MVTNDELWDLIQKVKAALEDRRKAWARFQESECDDWLWQEALRSNDAVYKARKALSQAIEEELGE